MTSIINLGNTNIATHKRNGIVVGMPESTLDAHLKKHPDIAKTPEDYLDEGTKVLQYGIPYKDGMLYGGIFCRAYNSQELGLKMVLTVHRRFS